VSKQNNHQVFPFSLLYIFISILFLFSCSDNKTIDNPADAIYHNGAILTMEDAQKQVEAVAIKDGKILAIGNLSSVKHHQASTTSMVDLKGKSLLPGFIDAHSHISIGMRMIQQADLSSPPVGKVQNIADIISQLKKHQAEYAIPKGEWIVAWGYDPDQLTEKRHPNKLDLDEHFPDHPVFLLHVSGHMSVVNSKALDMAKIDGKVPNPPGGMIVRLPNSKEPSGVLQEAASSAMIGNLPKPTEEQMFEQLAATQDFYASQGVTTAQDGFTDLVTMRFFQKAAAAGKLKLDIEALAGFQYAKDFIGNPEFPFGVAKDRLRIAGLKIVSDGSPQGKTAFFSKPYLTEVPGCAHDCRGIPILPLEQLTQLVQTCYQNNIQLYTHANGDGAIDLLLEAHEKSIATLPDPKKDLRTVIIHSQFVRSDQLDKYAEYNMIPSFFTNHAFFWGDVHLANLGEERASFLSPLQTATDLGITYTNHTDYIITPLDQLFLLWTATNRITRSGKVLGTTERVSPWEGLKANTINAAYQHKTETIKGSIAVGKLADFVILDKNPLAVELDAIKDIKVVETIKEGVTIYSK